jgi:hypothetical protein
MLQLVVLVVNEVDQVESVIEAWVEAGARGVTVLHSTGAGHLKDALRRDDVPLFPSLRDLLEHDDLHHRTLFTLVDEDALVDRLIDAAQGIIGDLDMAHTGILFTLPVGRALGLRRAPLE